MIKTLRPLVCALTLSLSFSGHAVAQERTTPPVMLEQVAAPPAARPALWKVADADTTIWLFGTIHALPKGVVWLDGTVANAFEGSQELITEITDDDGPALQSGVMEKATLPPKQNLRRLLTPKQRQKYEAAVTGLGLPVSGFDRYKPWYAAVALATMPLMRDGYSAENGVEGVLGARSKVLGQKHGALETFDYQLGLFNALPMPVQRRYLIEVIDGLPTLKTQLDAIVAAWQRGDAEHLAALMNDGQDDPAMMEALITGRNRAWARWIKARLDQPGTVFVAVGAGHLAGNGSVQAQLARRGIKVLRAQ